MLLTDYEVQSFIQSGLMKIDLPDLDRIHHQVDARLRELNEMESHHGNNILPRMPILQYVLRHEKVHGALTSLLGSDYLVHPHRAIHRSTPLEDRDVDFSMDSNAHVMGVGSTATSLWHQDAQSPLARARHHFPKFLLGFYFPHEVDSSMGPTRFLRASYCDNGPDQTRSIYQPEHVRAGTFFLAHFDIAHAGFPNFSDYDRYMLKFVFARTRSTTSPSWNNQSEDWAPGENREGESSLYHPAASYIWNRMLGKTSRELVSGRTSPGVSTELSAQDERLQSIYCSQDGLSLEDCVESLKTFVGRGKHERKQENLRDSTRGYPIRWNERAIVMEVGAYRLAALGDQSAEAVCALIESGDPWLQVNAAFVAGEIADSKSELSTLVAKLLESPHQQVVRQAIDALAFMQSPDSQKVLHRLERLVSKRQPSWQSAQVQRGWTATDQVDLNIATLLLAKCEEWEWDDVMAISVKMLERSNDYASSIVAEAMIRSGSLKAQKHAIRYYQDRAWNTSLLGKDKAY